MEKITSHDGTSIAFFRSGSGPPLVLVAGTGAANPLAWTGVIPGLDEHFTVIAIDRRGRGMSGDNPNYAIEREFEDVTAIIDGLNESAYLLGHSFGALLAMEAALRTPHLCKLILYEPWIPRPGVAMYLAGLIDRMERLLKSGDLEGVLISHYRDNVGLSPEEIEALKGSPAWPERLATAHTLPREMRAEEQYRFNAQQFAGLATPTLLMVGELSSPFVQESSRMIARALPNSRIAVLPGQEHLAMYTAPELFVKEVINFYKEPEL